MVVLDPPRFRPLAQGRRGRPAAATAGLQSLALRLLEPDGILVMCCCSGLITLDMLEELLAQVAADAQRDVQLLQRAARRRTIRCRSAAGSRIT